MDSIGFTRKATRYEHPESDYWVEFPSGPLAVGGDHGIRPVLIRSKSAATWALSATDSCLDRLAAFYHWKDRQSLRAAVEIARRKRVVLRSVQAWSQSGGRVEEYNELLRELERAKRQAAAPSRRHRKQS